LAGIPTIEESAIVCKSISQRKEQLRRFSHRLGSNTSSFRWQSLPASLVMRHFPQIIRRLFIVFRVNVVVELRHQVFRRKMVLVTKSEQAALCVTSVTDKTARKVCYFYAHKIKSQTSRKRGTESHGSLR
jgi:hypothetical protein